MLEMLTLAALIAGTWAGPIEPSPSAMAELEKATTAFDEPNCPAVLESVNRLKATPDYKQNDWVRRVLLEFSALCLSQSSQESDKAQAYAEAMLASDMQGSGDGVWGVRLDREVRTKDWPAAVTSFERVAAERPLYLNRVPLAWLNYIDLQLRRADQTALRRRYLALFADSSYWPEEPGGSTEGFRYRYALLLADAGEQEKADAIARLLTNPSLLMSLSLDPRFRPVLGDDLNLRAVTERYLTQLRTQVGRFPNAIRPVIDVAEHQRMLGRPQDALATLRTIEPAIKGDAPLSDRDDNVIWWWDQMSRAHRAAGDVPAAVAALRTASAIKEGNAVNVSHTINLANLQLNTGDPAGAVETLLPLAGAGDGTASPYGVMQIVGVRGCASHRLGRQAVADADLAYARAHIDDAPGTLTQLQLCRGDLDGAAASMIARLENKDQRHGALEELSTFNAPPNTLPRDPVVAELGKLRARPDVQAAARATSTFRSRASNTAL
ncbi:tetratricopeptide repeat protein [Sphingomonas dokdonensis]|uniref:Tetratricopeptide repeat protein n=1 Tax=Sphingomonas dokdonensis TaxID=344880 RepID=A0A245ZI06_9SPHN|nr:tetratricopeptide repeat protein [Sphingomonas dokdonensis]OWK29379.1 tetratricopeptide repeat protein [Sphingomonas dokdonensis]